MCKAKSCKYWKKCLVKRECCDFHCGDYEPQKTKPKKKENKR